MEEDLQPEISAAQDGINRMWDRINAAKAAKPKSWLRQWVGDQSFWRDFASRVSSGLIVPLVVYLFAVFGGYIKPLNIAWVITAILSGLAAIGILYFLGKYGFHLRHKNPLRVKLEIIFKGMIGMPLLVVLILLVRLSIVWGFALLVSLAWH